eukprot:2862864-Amphidinium_carterae.1
MRRACTDSLNAQLLNLPRYACKRLSERRVLVDVLVNVLVLDVLDVEEDVLLDVLEELLVLVDELVLDVLNVE